ncbi:hypothetical protein, partial [Bacillus sp. Nf3]|uniref:hypothetical protein n=1 Tax=Bacillus sp. Nf3 TaxID=2116541 RepID=UPI001C627DF3
MQPCKAPPTLTSLNRKPVSARHLHLLQQTTPSPVSGTVADVPLRHVDPFADPLLSDPDGTAGAQPAGRSTAQQ